MVKIKIVATGEIKDRNIKAITDEYYKRLSRWCKIEEVYLPEYPPKNDAEIALAKKKQAQMQMEKMEGYVIALDRTGKQLDSVEFAKLISKVQVNGESTITFLIGGSNGFSSDILQKANLVLSFGAFTLPHELMRAVLAEQIYRAFTINYKITYHK